jgi:hypothetical protein
MCSCLGSTLSTADKRSSDRVTHLDFRQRTRLPSVPPRCFQPSTHQASAVIADSTHIIFVFLFLASGQMPTGFALRSRIQPLRFRSRASLMDNFTFRLVVFLLGHPLPPIAPLQHCPAFAIRWGK